MASLETPDHHRTALQVEPNVSLANPRPDDTYDADNSEVDSLSIASSLGPDSTVEDPFADSLTKVDVNFCSAASTQRHVRKTKRLLKSEGLVCCDVGRDVRPGMVEIRGKEQLLEMATWNVFVLSPALCDSIDFMLLQGAALEVAIEKKKRNIIFLAEDSRSEGLCWKVFASFPKITMTGRRWQQKLVKLVREESQALCKEELAVQDSEKYADLLAHLRNLQRSLSAPSLDHISTDSDADHPTIPLSCSQTLHHRLRKRVTASPLSAKSFEVNSGPSPKPKKSKQNSLQERENMGSLEGPLDVAEDGTPGGWAKSEKPSPEQAVACSGHDTHSGASNPGALADSPQCGRVSRLFLYLLTVLAWVAKASFVVIKVVFPLVFRLLRFAVAVFMFPVKVFIGFLLIVSRSYNGMERENRERWDRLISGFMLIICYFMGRSSWIAKNPQRNELTAYGMRHGSLAVHNSPSLLTGYDKAVAVIGLLWLMGYWIVSHIIHTLRHNLKWRFIAATFAIVLVLSL